MSIDIKSSRNEFIEESEALNQKLANKVDEKKRVFWKKILKFLNYSNERD